MKLYGNPCTLMKLYILALLQDICTLNYLNITHTWWYLLLKSIDLRVHLSLIFPQLTKIYESRTIQNHFLLLNHWKKYHFWLWKLCKTILTKTKKIVWEPCFMNFLLCLSLRNSKDNLSEGFYSMEFCIYLTGLELKKKFNN